MADSVRTIKDELSAEFIQILRGPVVTAILAHELLLNVQGNVTVCSDAPPISAFPPWSRTDTKPENSTRGVVVRNFAAVGV